MAIYLPPMRQFEAPAVSLRVDMWRRARGADLDRGVGEVMSS